MSSSAYRESLEESIEGSIPGGYQKLDHGCGVPQSVIHARKSVHYSCRSNEYCTYWFVDSSSGAHDINSTKRLLSSDE